MVLLNQIIHNLCKMVGTVFHFTWHKKGKESEILLPILKKIVNKYIYKEHIHENIRDLKKNK